jgi:hypothetical protein
MKRSQLASRRMIAVCLFWLVGGCSQGNSTAPDSSFADSPSSLAALKILQRSRAVYLGTYDWASAPNRFDEATGTKSVLRGRGGNCLGEGEGLPIHADRACLDALDPNHIWAMGLEVAHAYSVDAVIAGAIDAELEQVADVVSDWGRPTFFLYQREPVLQFPGYGPTGDAFSHELQEDDDRTGQYGDPTKLDGPERFIAVHRRIHDVIEGHIAKLDRRSNITWVMGAVVVSEPEIYSAYYPGNSYVDWHAFDVYHGVVEEGVTPPCNNWGANVANRWKEAMALAADKPVLLVEFGASLAQCDRPVFFEDFFAQVRGGSFDRLGGLLYWQWNEPPFDTYLGLSGKDPASDAWRAELAAQPGQWSSCVLLSDGSTVPAGC